MLSQCLLMGPFALVIQALMGLIAISSLILKRYKEHPRRPWWVWFFDVSKQIIGSAGLHVINLILSIFISSGDIPDMDDNPCNWYFVNILLDTTVGVPILWFFLYLLQGWVLRMGISGVISGVYGDPPQWISFFKQATVYMTAMILMKITLAVFLWITGSMIDDLGELLIGWTSFDSRLQVFFVMMFFPLFMNSLQYYLIDTIIQANTYHNREPLLGVRSSTCTLNYGSLNGRSVDITDDTDGQSIGKSPKITPITPSSARSISEEIDPIT